MEKITLVAISVALSGFITLAGGGSDAFAQRGYSDAPCRERLVNRRGEGYWGPGRNCDEEDGRRSSRRGRDGEGIFRGASRGDRDDRACRKRLVNRKGEGFWGPGRNCDEEDGRRGRGRRD